MRSEFK